MYLHRYQQSRDNNAMSLYCYLVLFSWCSGYFFGGRRDNHWELTIITSLVTIFSGDCIFYRLSFKVSAWITLQILSLQCNKDKVDWKLKCHCILFFFTQAANMNLNRNQIVSCSKALFYFHSSNHTHMCVHCPLCPMSLFALYLLLMLRCMA